MEYENLSLPELKELGHRLLNEYVFLDLNPTRRAYNRKLNHAYDKLWFKMYGKRKNPEEYFEKHHFSNMHTRDEAMHAVAVLKRMIKKRQYKNEFYARHKDVYAPREVQKLSYEEARQVNQTQET